MILLKEIFISQNIAKIIKTLLCMAPNNRKNIINFLSLIILLLISNNDINISL